MRNAISYGEPREGPGYCVVFGSASSISRQFQFSRLFRAMRIVAAPNGGWEQNTSCEQKFSRGAAATEKPALVSAPSSLVEAIVGEANIERSWKTFAFTSLILQPSIPSGLSVTGLFIEWLQALLRRFQFFVSKSNQGIKKVAKVRQSGSIWECFEHPPSPSSFCHSRIRFVWDKMNPMKILFLHRRLFCHSLLGTAQTNRR